MAGGRAVTLTIKFVSKEIVYAIKSEAIWPFIGGPLPVDDQYR